MIAISRLGLLCLALLWQGAQAAEPFWLSDAPPDGKAASRQHKAHGGPLERGKRGINNKRLWLRSGHTLASAAYTDGAQNLSPALLLSPSQKTTELMPQAQDGRYNLLFPMPEEGFYNVYLKQQRVVDGRLELAIAKAEVLKHSCREGHDHVQSKMPPNHAPKMPLEIVRERLPKEDFHTRIGYGDELVFRVLTRGEPVADAEVTLHTATGWRKTARSDDEGRVHFTVIRDYFPAWEVFESRHRQAFLATAVFETDGAGQFDGTPYAGTRYVSTLAGHYYPSTRDYRSYAYGLLIGLFALTFTGLGVYLYRRRRMRPFREVHFDE